MQDTIRKLQQDFDDAELHADRERLKQLIAEDFLSIGPKGFVLNKDEWIGRHVHFKYHALDTSEMDVRLYDKTAIVRDVQKNRATYQDQTIQLTVRVSQVWVKQEDGEWRLAAIQFSPMPDGQQ
jgi:hypothetical protein